MAAFSKIKEATIFAVVPPAISELGNATGFQLQLEDRGGLGHEALIAARDQLLGMAAKEPALTRVRQGGLEDTPQYKIDVDREKAAALGLSLTDINATLAATWGGSYVNDFIDRGRTKRVYLQGDAPFRMQPEDLDRWYVRNKAGEMVPFSAFSTGRWTYGSPKLDRFGGFPTILIQGEAGPGGFASGDAMATMERLIGELPPASASSGRACRYEERVAGANAPACTPVAAGRVPVPRRAVRELVDPVSVMLVVPLGVARGRGHDPRGSGWPTTCTSRSACSPRSACRPRTRSSSSSSPASCRSRARTASRRR
jgi:multidrug efflux pump subunit AcrB